MIGEAFFMAVQEFVAALAYRLSDLVRIPNSQGLQLALQFLVFIALIALLVLVVVSLVWSMSWLAA